MMRKEVNKTGNSKLTDGAKAVIRAVRNAALKKEPGIDGILVTVGLCIIALLLCVVMKDSMTSFIQTIISTLTSEAQKILTGVTGVVL